MNACKMGLIDLDSGSRGFSGSDETNGGDRTDETNRLRGNKEGDGEDSDAKSQEGASKT